MLKQLSSGKFVAVAVLLFALAGCGGGGGGARTAVPQMTSQGRSMGATISGTIYMASESSASRSSARTARARDPFLSKIPKSSKQILDEPEAGFEPLAGATVSANLDGQAFQTTTDANGEWQATGVPEGTQEFVVSKGDKKVTVPVTVKKDTEHKNQMQIQEDEDCGGGGTVVPSRQLLYSVDDDSTCEWEAESQTIHEDGSDGYKKEKHDDGSSDTLHENGNRDSHKTDGETDRDVNDDGIVDQRFTDEDDDGVPDGEIEYVGGDELDDETTPDSASVDNEPPVIDSLTAKDSKGKSKNSTDCSESLDMDLDMSDADGDSTTVKWTVTDVEGNDVTDLYLNADDIVAPTFSPPSGECSKPGAYIISAEVTDNNSHISGKDVIVTTETPDNKSPIASIKANHTAGEAPLTVDFECVAKDKDGTIVSYCWDFDKSNGIDINDCDDTEYQVTKTYISEGKYRATCIVYDDDGAVAFDKRVIVVRKSVDAEPTIEIFDPEDDEVAPGESVDIDVSIDDPGNEVEDTEVDATGGTFTDDDPDDGSVTWKAPEDGGEFVLEVKITYADGSTETKREKIVVDTENNKAPHAVAVALPETGDDPLTVTLSVDVTDDDGTIQTIEWDLNDRDGFTAEKTGESITAKFGTPGRYTATVRACDDKNSCAWDKVDILVTRANRPPSLNCYVSDETVGVSGDVTLNVAADDMNNDNLTYTWQADGGTIDESADPVTMWTLPGAAGTYTATVTVSDGVNSPVVCQSSVTVEVAEEEPEAPGKCRATGDNGVAHVNWDPCPGDDITWYRLYRDSGNGFQPLAEVQATAALEYEDTDVTNGQTYRYRVTCMNGADVESDPSDSSEATPDGDVKEVVDVGEDPSDAEYNDETDEVIIPEEGDDQVVVIDPDTGEVEDEIDVGDEPVDTCIDPETGDIYVVNAGDNTLTMIDGPTKVVEGTISIDPDSNACVVIDDKVVVSDPGEDDVDVYDPDTGEKEGEIEVGDEPTVCGAHEGSGQIYVTNKNSNTLSILDIVTMSQISEITVGYGPSGCAVNSTDNMVYVANKNSNTVTIVNGNTKQVEKTVPVGGSPVCGCDVNEISNQIVISNTTDNTITIIDGVTQEAVETVNVGEGPSGACYKDSTNEIFVSNEISNTVTIITSPLPNTPTVEPGDGEAPDAPGKCYATGKNGAVELTWEESPGAYAYNIYRAEGANSAFTLLGIDNLLAQAYEDSTASNGYKYRYKVSAKDSEGDEGSACDYVEATPDQDVEEVLDVGDDPSDSVYDPVNKMIWVPVEEEDEVVVIDPDTGEIDSTVLVGDGPSDACSNPQTGEIYVLNTNENTMSVINSVSFTVTQTVTIEAGSNACAAGNGNIYISNENTNTLTILNDETFAEEGEVSTGDEPTVCGVDEGSGQVYVTNRNDNTLSIIDGINQSQITEITVGSAPAGCAVNSANNMIYVANENSNTVTVVNGTSRQAEKTLTVGDSPVCGCDVNETANQIVISNTTDNTVTIIDGATQEVAETVHTGENPSGACVDEENNKIYISNEYSNTVTIISNPLPNTPTDIEAPAAPAKCYATGSNGKALISWDASDSDDVSSYILQRDDGAGGAFTNLATPNAYTHEYEDTSVTNGNQYRYRVRARDGNMNTGNACDDVTATPDDDVLEAGDVGDSPGSAVYCPGSGQIFVVNENSNSVSVLDSVTLEQTSEIAVGDGASGACAPDDCGNIYVTNKNDNSISVIDTGSVSISQTVSVSGGPSSCVVNENTNEIYVGLEDNDSVAVLDEDTLTQEAEISVGDDPTVCGADDSSGKVYVTNTNDNTLSLLDGISHVQETVISVGSAPSGCAAGQADNLVFVANKNDNTITVVNATTGTVESTIDLPSGDEGPDCTGGCSVDESTNQVMITNSISNTITLINGSQLTVEDSVETGGDSPAAVVADESNHEIIIVNKMSNSVTIIGNPLPDTAVDNVAPNAPDSCYATGKSDRVRVSWDQVPAFDLDKYVVYRSDTSGSGFTELEQIGSSGNFMEDTTAAVGSTYYYIVTAVDEMGNESDACDEVSGTADENIEDIIDTGETPCCMAGDSVNNYIYISNEVENSITVINRDTYQYVKTIDMSGAGGCCSDIEVDTINNKIYVTNKNTNKVTVINGTTHVIEETVTVPGNGGAGRCEYNELTNEIYIVNDETNEVVIMNPDTWEYRKVYVDIGGCPCDVQVNRYTNEVYILNKMTDKVTIINGNDYTVVETVTVGGAGGEASGCVLNEETNSLYITNENSNEVFVMNTTEHVITQTITIPGTDPGPSCGSNGCACDPGSNQIYISNINENTISIINGEDFSVADTIYVGEDPVSLDVDPETGTLFVLNKQSSSVSIVNNPLPSTPTDTTAPATPTGLIAVTKSSSIDLSWNNNTEGDINGYKVYRSDNPDNGYSALTLGTTSNSYSDTTVEDDTVYYYKLSAVDTTGNESDLTSYVQGYVDSPSVVYVGDGPTDVAVDETNNLVYIANSDSGNVTIIDAQTNTITDLVTVDNQPMAIAVSETDNIAVTANGTFNTISVIDGGAGNSSTDYAAGLFPGGVDIDETGGYIFLSQPGTAQVARMNIGGYSINANGSTGSLPGGVAVDSASRNVYAANYADDTITILDADTMATKATLPVGNTPAAVEVNETTNRAYVSNYANGTVSVISGATLSVISTITVGTEPMGIAVDETRNLIYVANTSSGTVSVIDGSTNKVIGTIEVENDPWGIGVHETLNKLFIAVLTPNKVIIRDGFKEENDGCYVGAPAGATACCVSGPEPEYMICPTVIEWTCASDGTIHMSRCGICYDDSIDYWKPAGGGFGWDQATCEW